MDESPRLALVPEVPREPWQCAYADCLALPTETLTRDGVERLYCEGHARLEAARPTLLTVIEPLPEGALRPDGWLEGWEARRIDTLRERKHWYEQGLREGRRIAEQEATGARVATLGVVAALALVAGFLLGVYLATA